MNSAFVQPGCDLAGAVHPACFPPIPVSLLPESSFLALTLCAASRLLPSIVVLEHCECLCAGFEQVQQTIEATAKPKSYRMVELDIHGKEQRALLQADKARPKEPAL